MNPLWPCEASFGKGRVVWMGLWYDFPPCRRVQRCYVVRPPEQKGSCYLSHHFSKGSWCSFSGGVLVVGRCIAFNSSAWFVSCRRSRTLHIYSSLMRCKGSTYVQGLRTRQQPFQATLSQLFWSVWFSCCTVHVNNWTGLNYCFTIPNIKVIFTIPANIRSRLTYWILTNIEVWGPRVARCVKVGYPSWSNSNLGGKNLSGFHGTQFFLGWKSNNTNLYISSGNFQAFPEIYNAWS